MKVFVNSMPKSGTNMVQLLVEKMGYTYSNRSLAASSTTGRYEFIKKMLRSPCFSRADVHLGVEYDASVSSQWLQRYVSSVAERQYLSGHAAYSGYLGSLLSDEVIKIILVLRNPIDVLLSMTKYIVEPQNTWYPFHSYLASLEFMERAEFLVRGGLDSHSGRYYRGMKFQYAALEGWLDYKGLLVVRFEDLVGKKGGGSDSQQKKVIENVATFTGMDPSLANQISSSLFGHGPTFRGGQIGKGKVILGDQIVYLVEEELKHSKLLAKSGYFKP